MKLLCKLDSAVAGPGFVIKRGTYTGEADALGVVWMDVIATSRVAGTEATRRIGIHVSKFSYVQEATAVTVAAAVDKRAEVNKAIKAANAAAAKAGAKA